MFKLHFPVLKSQTNIDVHSGLGRIDENNAMPFNHSPYYCPNFNRAA